MHQIGDILVSKSTRRYWERRGDVGRAPKVVVVDTDNGRVEVYRPRYRDRVYLARPEAWEKVGAQLAMTLAGGAGGRLE